MYHRHFKVVIMGNSGVGKTALLQRGIRGTFDSCFIATIGVDFMIKTVEIGGVQYKVQFWDTAGQERFRSISPALFRKADGIILAFSMVDENSISQMDYWIDLTKKVDCNPSFFIVGTKNDLVDNSNSYIANIEQLQKKYKSISEKIWITSSKTGENIEQTFQDIVETVVRNRPDNTDTKPVVVREEPKYRSSCCFSRQSLEKKPEITKCKLIFRFCGNNPFSLEFEGNTKMQNVFEKVSTIVHFPVSELEFNYSNSKILESSICNTYKDREIDVFHHKNIAFSHKEQVINIDFNTKNTTLDARIKLADIFNISFEKLYLYINGEKLEDSTNLYSINNSPIYVISKDEKFYFELPNGGTYKKRFKNNTPVSSAKSKIAIICGCKVDDIEFSIKGKAISDKEKLNALSDKTITVKIHGYTGNKENAYIYSTSSSSINSSQTDTISHSTSSSVSDKSLSERIPPGNPTINDLVEIPISRPKSISERFLKISDFVNQEIIIGRGSFGEIRLYKEIKTGIQVAFKKIMKFPDGTAVASILEELDTMNAANHPAVVPFLGFIPPEGKTLEGIIIVTQFMPNLTLTENIYNTEYRSLSMTEKFNIAFGIACGMRHLHKNHIIHRDLKPDNVLIDHDMHPRISDFGLSKFLEKGYASTAAKGTPAYMAPEVISGDEYTYSADVYSYGILINELFSAKKPFNDVPTLFALFNRVLDNQRPEITSNTPPQFASLIKDCWCSEPNKRPSFDQIVERLQRDDFILDGIDQKDVSSYRSIANVV